jgi:hypothetical protein
MDEVVATAACPCRPRDSRGGMAAALMIGTESAVVSAYVLSTC